MLDLSKITMINYTVFKKLHQNDHPFLLGNVWNVQSAKAFEKAGYKAIGTSSAAIANSLGFKDGENMSFKDYLFIIEKICAATNLPVSVDLESGYGNTSEEIIENIKKLHSLGVVGINIEDSHVIDGQRFLKGSNEFSTNLTNIISAIKADKIEMFVNVRSDVFLMDVENALEEAKVRISQFQDADANGIFLPCLTDNAIIKELSSFTNLPINLMAMPDLPDFETLKNLGIKRISSGNFLNNFIYENLENTARQIVEQQNFDSIFHYA